MKAGYKDKISFRSGSQLFTKGVLLVSTAPPPPPPLYSWTEIIGAYMIPYTTLSQTTGENYKTYKLDGINNLYMIPFITLQIPLLDIMQYPVFNQTFATYMEAVGLSTIPYATLSPATSETYTGFSESVSLTS